MTWKFAAVLISKGERMFCFDKNHVWKRRSETAGTKRNNLEIICCLPSWVESHQIGILSHKGLYLKAPPQGSQNSVGPVLTRSSHPLLNSCQFRVTRRPGRASRALDTGPEGWQVPQGRSPGAGRGQAGQGNPQGLCCALPSSATKPGLCPPAPLLPSELRTAPAQSCRKGKVETTV